VVSGRKNKRGSTTTFGTNDIPSFEQAVKGSEKDRTLVIYFPNTFKNKDESSTAPRTFDKDERMEKVVSGNDFALGHLLNLVQIR
jgi:hypothetical protein